MSTDRVAPERLPPAARLALAGLAGLAGLAAAAGAASCSRSSSATGSAGTAAAALSVAAPLASSSVSASGRAWATVPMGHQAGENLFWELLTRATPRSRWRLVTPPGVADNGGLVVAPEGGLGLLAGFLPSQYLRFSPLSATSDAGRTWTPGLLPAALVRGPDSLAGTRGASYALVTSSGGQVLASTTSLSSWRPVADRSAVAAAPAAARCGLRRLTAVAVTSTGGVLVGGPCRRPGTVGIFAREGGRGWRVAGPPLPAGLGRDPVDVVRLGSEGTANFALLDVRSARGHQVVAGWSTDGGVTWATTPALSIPGPDRLAGAGFGPAGGAYILATNGSRPAQLEVTAGPGARWARLPAPPVGTVVVVPPAGGPPPTGSASAAGYQVLASTGTVFTAYGPNPGGGWTETQRTRVAVPFGSSD